MIAAQEIAKKNLNPGCASTGEEAQNAYDNPR
jgi:hypothetical protein